MVFRVATVVALLAFASAGSADAARAAKPFTVPAVRSYKAVDLGRFHITKHTRVVAPARSKRLNAEARTLAHDLHVRHAHAPARPGDVLLRLTHRRKRLGREGYALAITHDGATIRARTTAGVFYGGRTLLQLLDNKKRATHAARIRDRPRYRDRGLMIDNGRQFFTRAWLTQRVRELAGLKLNLLHLHFSDDQGFRFASDTHPEVVSDPHLTKADLKALVKTARRYHVTIVPELDMPGHMTAALAQHPELQLENAAGQKQRDKLDVTLPAARAFVADLLNGYMPLFPGPWWHAGADEYLGVASTEQDYDLYPQLEAYADAKYGENANGKDAVLDFVNFVAGIAREHGKRIRTWSDGIGGGSAVTLDKGAAVEWWENRASEPPQQLMAEGRQVQNAGWWPLYYVTGGPLMGLRASEREMYEDWSANVFEGPWSTRWFTGDPGGARYEVPKDAKNQLGAQLNVWNDDPGNMSQDEIADGIRPRLRILAQKTWGSPQLTDSYEEFERQTR